MSFEARQINAILPNLRSTSRKQILKDMAAEMASHFNIRADIIYNRLAKKAAPSKCNASDGVMILDITLSAVDAPFKTLVRLQQGYDFAGMGGAPVDLILVVISPEHDKISHLQDLARWSRRMKDIQFCDTLRRAEDLEDMYLALAAHNRPHRLAA